MKITSCLLYLLLSTTATSQKIANTILLATKSADSVSDNVEARAIFNVRSGTTNFTASIELFPLLTDSNIADSLDQMNKPLVLQLDGDFPTNRLDFINTSVNPKSYSMKVNASLNDSSRQFVLSFTLFTPVDPLFTPDNYMRKYQTRMKFTIPIQSSLYGLDQPPFNLPEVVLVQVNDAIIGK